MSGVVFLIFVFLFLSFSLSIFYTISTSRVTYLKEEETLPFVITFITNNSRIYINVFMYIIESLKHEHYFSIIIYLYFYVTRGSTFTHLLLIMYYIYQAVIFCIYIFVFTTSVQNKKKNHVQVLKCNS